MIKLINSPSIVKAAGTKEKIIEEFFGKVNSNDKEISIARMKSPQGWEEPGQKPEFDEYTIVLKGKLKVKTNTDEFHVNAGQGIFVGKNEWILTFFACFATLCETRPC